MLVEYQLEITSTCPVDDKKDVYHCTVRSRRTIKAEDIRAAAESLADKRLFQEELTQELHRLLSAEVETVGDHSGVRTKVTCGGKGDVRPGKD